MPLDEYKKKRSFTKTPEPTGGNPADDGFIGSIGLYSASSANPYGIAATSVTSSAGTWNSCTSRQAKTTNVA